MPTTEGDDEGPRAEEPGQRSAPLRESPRLQTGELHALVDAALPAAELEELGPDAEVLEAAEADPDLTEPEPRPAAPRAPAPDPYVGLVIDRRYEIEKLIAAGGMGLVYRCRHRVLGKKLALKIIRTDVAQMPDGPERFLLEAKAASAIGNEHIVDIIDFGELPDGASYLVMEYLDGLPLSTLMKREPRFEVPRLADIACQIAEGLGAAHSAGIVHRDLKPDNVFVLERKAGDFVKILDFGVARMAQSAKKLTQAGTIVGTPHYMSPEQAVGKDVDQRGDIYALGIILYELCAGQVPFDGTHYVAVLHQHLQVEPPKLASLDPPVHVPPELERIVTKCLAKDPEQRYAAMSELASDLAEFCAHSRGRVPTGSVEPSPSGNAASSPGLSTAELPAPLADEAAGVLPPPSAPAALPLPTAPLPVASPTLVLARPSIVVTLEQKRRVSGVAIVVLLVTCALAAWSLGRSKDEPGPATPAPRAAEALAPAAAEPRPVAPRPAEPVRVAPIEAEQPPAAAPAPAASPAPTASDARPPKASSRRSGAGTGARARPRKAEKPEKPERQERPAQREEFVNPWPSPR